MLKKKMSKRIMQIFKRLILFVFIFAITLNIVVFGEMAVFSFDVTNLGTTFNGSVPTEVNTDGIKSIMATILTITRNVGVGIAIIMLIYIGIKIIVASPGEKATVKEYAINYVIGAFILIAASGILGIIQTIASEIKIT